MSSRRSERPNFDSLLDSVWAPRASLIAPKVAKGGDKKAPKEAPAFSHSDVKFFKFCKDKHLESGSLNYLSNFHGGAPGERRGNNQGWPVPAPCNIPVIWRPDAGSASEMVGTSCEVGLDGAKVYLWAKTSEQVFMLCKLAHWERAIRDISGKIDFEMTGIRTILLRSDLEPGKARAAMGRKTTIGEVLKISCSMTEAQALNEHAAKTWGEYEITGDPWSAPRVQAMLKVLRLKFFHGKKILQQVLMNTGDDRLGESDGRGGEHFWECSRKFDFDNITHNWLGRLLMKVREELVWQHLANI